MRSRASCARGPACCASDTPRCASRVRCRWPAVSVREPPHQPGAHRRRADQEHTAAPRPARGRARPPSAPSIADSGTTTPSAVSGADALPRSPSPSNAPATDRPAERRPAPATASSARPVRPAERPARPDVAVRVPGRGDPALGRVQPHGRPVRLSGPRWTSAPRSGDRDPVSENASVDRCRPPAISVSVSLSAPADQRGDRRCSAWSRSSRWTRRPSRARGPPPPPRAARRRRRRTRPGPSAPAARPRRARRAAARGNSPDASTAAAPGATTSSMTRRSASRNHS